MELFDQRLGLNAALFETRKTNARSTDPQGIITIDGENRVRGIELTATGKLTPRWDISAGYSYLDSELLDGGYVNAGNKCLHRTMWPIPLMATS